MTSLPAADPADPADGFDGFDGDLVGGAARDLLALAGSQLAHAGVVGIGIDAVDLGRFRTVLERRPRLVERMFTPDELAYAEGARDRVPRLATRFATKEAVMKALGVGLWSFRLTDVEVVRFGLDAPSLSLHGAAGDLARTAGALRWHLSLTHTDKVAMAVVVADGGLPMPGGVPPRSTDPTDLGS